MVYKCSICGYIFDEKEQGRPFSELTECPMCKQPIEKFEQIPSEPAESPAGTDAPSPAGAQAGALQEGPFADSAQGSAEPNLNYPKETRRTDSNYRYMKESMKWQSLASPQLKPWGPKGACQIGMTS